jgi:protein-tyrosine phosphatase
VTELPHLDVDGVSNFRQVVVPSTQHGALRADRLFRCGTLTGLTDAGRSTIAALGITDVVDLRSPVDVAGNEPPDVGTTVAVHPIPVSTDPTGTHPVGAAIRSRDRARMYDAIADTALVVEWMRLGYVRMALEETASFARVLRVVADADGGVVVNCAAGKDRTGWAVALVLLAVGTDVDAVTDEFLLSNRAPVAAATDPDVARRMEPLTGVRADYLYAGLDAVAERWPSIDDYLRDALDVDDELRERLVVSLVDGTPA